MSEILKAKETAGGEMDIYDLLILAEEAPAKATYILNAAWDFRTEKFWEVFTMIFQCCPN